MPTLTVLQGPDKGQRYSVADCETVPLGRASKLVPLTDYTVSRQHAQVKREGRGWAVDDLKSANGTYLNGKRLERPSVLKHGDQIRMGGTLLIWDAADERGLVPSEHGADIRADQVDLDAGSRGAPSIIGSVAGGGDDSMILATPAAAEAVRSWRVMSSLLDAVGAILSPEQLVERVMSLLVQEVPVDRGFILVKSPSSGQYETQAVHMADESSERIRASRTIIDHVIKNREGILCSNASSDARFADPTAAGGSLVEMGLQSIICVPLVSREDVLGVIYIDSAMAKHIYSEEQLRLVAAIGQMAGLAIEDARLVNERVRTERLAAAGETVAALSHYIKNILQGMMGGSDIVEMGLQSQALPTVDQGWQVVRRNLDKIYSLTMNMLAFAKKREPRLEPVQLNLVVDDVLKLCARRADDKSVLIKSVLGEPMPAIPLDEHGIHQVVLNIVANAIDAVPRTTGVVTVKTGFDEQRQAGVVIVGDNGPGIPEKVRQRIFDAFYSTKGQGGTGLGLAVAKKIIDEHGGQIAVTGLPGQGTVIRVILPVRTGQDVDSAATHGPAQPT